MASKTEVRLYQPADYEALMEPAPFLNVPSVARQFAGGGPAFSAFVDGELAACAGVQLFPWPIGEAWAVLGPVGRAHPLFVSRSVVRGLIDIIRQHKLRRVQADVLVHFAAARRWVEWMGFEPEGLMRAYAPDGSDMIRYALLPKENL